MTERLPIDSISEGVIRAFAANCNVRLSEPEQIAFLLNLDSLDLQAAPGSGKTTLVGLKIGQLVESWRSTSSGLLVLSHTNTAKSEILQRLNGTSAGQKLADRPHFIGTIQSFAHTFLTSSCLRSLGVPFASIDDDVYASAALRQLHEDNTFITLRQFLARRQGGDDLVANARFRYQDQKLSIVTSSPLPFGPETKSGVQFELIKKRLSNDGIFRYSDAFALAHYHIDTNPGFLAALRRRFPFVIIDEMQDTNQYQSELLGEVFNPTTTVVQRIGDVNQQIFGDASAPTESGFPRRDCIELPRSHRFGESIAAVATRLTVMRSQQIRGNTDRTTELAIIVYEPSTAKMVPACFAQLLSLQTPVIDPADARILGSRIRPSSSVKFPKTLMCYLPDGSAVGLSGRSANESFVDAARLGHSYTTHAGTGSQVAEALWSTFAATLSDLQFRIDNRRPTASSAKRHLLATHPDLLITLRRLFRDIVSTKQDEATWQQSRNALGEIIQHVSGVGPATVLQTPRLQWTERQGHSGRPSAIPDGGNEYPAAHLIQPSSVHNAKGETHAAVLVVECLDPQGKAYDLSPLLPIITGRNPSTSLTPAKLAVARTLFVALTRPTSLLALAIGAERAQPHLAALRAGGWSIHTA